MRGRRESRLYLCIERGGEEVGLREGVGAMDGVIEKRRVCAFLYQYGRRWNLISFFGRVFRH
jgi:hypothetical protein